jgi:hypothetical protein
MMAIGDRSSQEILLHVRFGGRGVLWNGPRPALAKPPMKGRSNAEKTEQGKDNILISGFGARARPVGLSNGGVYFRSLG